MSLFNINIFKNLDKEIIANGIPEEVIRMAYAQNNWFTKENVLLALKAIQSSMLNGSELDDWLSKYQYKDISSKRIAIIMAGNIPFVGFADLLTVLSLGAVPCVKLASKDMVLMQWIIGELNELGAGIEYLNQGGQIDAVIATGSNNANRYFEQEFGNLPKLLRHSRVSVAVITAETTNQEIELLWEDCFRYFGLGCRNVSHIFIPHDYSFDNLVALWRNKFFYHSDFEANYRQNKALLTMMKQSFVDSGYYLLHKSDLLSGALSTITYSYYDIIKEVEDIIHHNSNNIQCIVSASEVKFGSAQSPKLLDYADGIDIVEFLYGI